MKQFGVEKVPSRVDILGMLCCMVLFSGMEPVSYEQGQLVWKEAEILLLTVLAQALKRLTGMKERQGAAVEIGTGNDL